MSSLTWSSDYREASHVLFNNLKTNTNALAQLEKDAVAFVKSSIGKLQEKKPLEYWA
jgi:hypothetical protein